MNLDESRPLTPRTPPSLCCLVASWINCQKKKRTKKKSYIELVPRPRSNLGPFGTCSGGYLDNASPPPHFALFLPSPFPFPFQGARTACAALLPDPLSTFLALLNRPLDSTTSNQRQRIAPDGGPSLFFPRGVVKAANHDILGLRRGGATSSKRRDAEANPVLLLAHLFCASGYYYYYYYCYYYYHLASSRLLDVLLFLSFLSLFVSEFYPGR